jgi:transposase-like protein
MIAESQEPGASVAKVAHRHGVNANLLFTWRRQFAARTTIQDNLNRTASKFSIAPG